MAVVDTRRDAGSAAPSAGELAGDPRATESKKRLKERRMPALVRLYGFRQPAMPYWQRAG
jgi:hypothetical protein